jgi:hypothetical protein
MSRIFPEESLGHFQNASDISEMTRTFPVIPNIPAGVKKGLGRTDKKRRMYESGFALNE